MANCHINNLAIIINYYGVESQIVAWKNFGDHFLMTKKIACELGIVHVSNRVESH